MAGLWKAYKEGGVVMMSIILVWSIFTIGIIIERALYLYGSSINKDVFLEAAAGYEGATFSPFQNYAYDQLTEQIYAMVQGEKDASQALDDLQASLEQYATEQGFTLK